MSKLPQAVPTVQVDNERVRVTEWRFAPGARPASTCTRWTTWSCRSVTAG